jgi:hypothetical protein
MESPKSMHLVAHIQGLSVMVLVDSGSSHTFISKEVAGRLFWVSALLKPLSVKVANDSVVICSSQLHNSAWAIQGYQFFSDFKIIPLLHFDVILGYDWLKSFSPMKVHWTEKWMQIPYGTDIVLIQGILSQLSSGAVLQVCELSEEELKLDIDDCAPALCDFHQIFRSC